MIAVRNLFFLYLIGLIYFTNMITDCINTYIGEEKVNCFYNIIESSKLLIVVIFSFISIISIKNFIYQIVNDYVSDYRFPIKATEWILENCDKDNMRIWTSFNWGSYLELNEIKVFVDSRSGMYTEQENKGCTVLNDWYQVENDKTDYEEIFEKYEITHILVENGSKLNKCLSGDNNYKLIYEDSSFKLYEKQE